jgi:hypothetical protein
MNIFKLLVLLIIVCAAFETFAQTREEPTTSAQQATTATTTTVQSSTARKPQRTAGKSHASQSASGTITAQPDVVANLCCGSVNVQSMTGNNCSYLAGGGGCAGFVLACPNGTTNKVDADENGYCKPD